MVVSDLCCILDTCLDDDVVQGATDIQKDSPESGWRMDVAEDEEDTEKEAPWQ